ncbi:MAG: type I polyketide synthase, partial [Vicinamibacteria bacterium]
ARVIEQALEATGVHPETIGYVEAHGTATSLGDPAEIAGLTKAYRRWTDKSSYCAIGSVKTNIGHLDAAAGVAGFIKTILALENREIPASLHFESPNPQIDFESSPFYVNTRLEPWESTNGPRRAGLSSFGFGGTNAHAILEEAPPRPASDPARPFHLLLISAKTETALDRATANLSTHLASHPETNLADVAYTLQVGRHVFNHRRAIVARDVEDAKQALADAGRWETSRQDRQHAPVAFMFTGQGSQYVAMAKGLYQGEDAFRAAVEECCRILKEGAGLDLLTILYPEGSDLEAGSDRLKDTEVTQPALFVIEYAMTRLLSSWGVEPQAMIGHSIGEYVAAHLAGVFSLEDALVLVAERGRLMQSLPPGAMLAVPLSEDAVAPYLGGDVDLASANAPSATVLSGSIDAIDRVERELSDRSVMSRRLHTSHAFHSSMMESILARFEEKVRGISMRAPKIPFVSNVTGRWIEAERATAADYWSQHLRSAVRFYQGVETLLAEGSPVLVEVGPGNTLASLARQLPQKEEAPTVVTTIRHPKESRDDRAFFLGAMGRLWLAGTHIEWSRVYERERRLRIPLPTYPFERERFWVEKNEDVQRAREIATGVTYRRQKLEDWFYQISWHRFMPPEMASEPSLAASNRWLVFEDEVGAAAGFEEELRSRGQKLVRVRAGEGFSGDEASGFSIRPGERGDYLALVQALAGTSGVPTHVAHFWSMTADGDGREIE